MKAHEEVIPSNLENRVSKLISNGFYKPIIVDSVTGVILDGHHKWTAAGLLNLDRVPVILANYMEDSSIIVDVWPDCGREAISKQEVIDMGLSDKVFPPKTSRHFFPFAVPAIQMPLEELRE
ncbi:MAG: ParB N-terminal domain-containing protein [Candidatus Thalassarchaeaceae archaeon]|nr:ParB N-terminal domain-containing protein [Candidatus Thalassarchaeaceae archaeon]